MVDPACGRRGHHPQDHCSSASWPPTTRWARSQPIREIGNVCRSRPRPVPRGCHPGGPVAAHRLRRLAGGPCLALRSQALWAQGRRRALRAQGHPARPAVPGRSPRSANAARGRRTSRPRWGSPTALALAAADPARAAGREPRQASLRDDLLAGLTAIDGVRATGHPTRRLPNSASVVIDRDPGRRPGGRLDLEGVEVSTGSACTTGSVEPSHVLLALGIDEERAAGSLRLTLGRGDDPRRDRHRLGVIEGCIRRLRNAAGALSEAQPATAMGAPSA